MRKPEYITASAAPGFHFTHETETQVQLIAVDRPVTESLIEYASAVLGLLLASQDPIEDESDSKRSYISVIFNKTEKFEALRAFL